MELVNKDLMALQEQQLGSKDLNYTNKQTKAFEPHPIRDPEAMIWKIQAFPRSLHHKASSVLELLLPATNNMANDHLDTALRTKNPMVSLHAGEKLRLNK